MLCSKGSPARRELRAGGGARRFACRDYTTRPQQFLYFFPLPHGHGSLRPTFGMARRDGRSRVISLSPSPLPVTAAIAPTRCRSRTGAFAVDEVGACSRKRNCGRLARKFSNACKFDV